MQVTEELTGPGDVFQDPAPLPSGLFPGKGRPSSPTPPLPVISLTVSCLAAQLGNGYPAAGPGLGLGKLCLCPKRVQSFVTEG